MKKLNIKDMVSKLETSPAADQQTPPPPGNEADAPVTRKKRRHKEEGKGFSIILKISDFNKIEELLRKSNKNRSLGRVSTAAIIRAALRATDGGDAFKAALEEIINEDGRRPM